MLDVTRPKSICILGRQPALGLAELESLYGAPTISRIGSRVAGLQLPLLDIDMLRLGGSTRTATVITELPAIDWKLVEKFFISAVVDRLQSGVEGKLKIGLSAFDFTITPARLNATALSLKKAIRNTGRSVRIVPNQSLELNTAQIIHNGLTKPLGSEFLLIKKQHTTLLAKTVLTQDIANYTLRDRSRPKRDARVGMLPPKLAQIIINLAVGQVELRHESQATNHKLAAGSPPPHSTFYILDPFCGTGVVLQEALLMDYKVIGTDLEPRMIDYTKQNLAWLKANYHHQLPITSYQLEQGDATAHKWQPQPNAVATETYLGHPFTETPTPQALAQTVSDVNLILKKFLQNIRGQLPAGTRLCIAVPAWQIGPGTFRHLPLIDQLSELGYNRVSFEHVRSDQLLYYREDQIVARQLLALTRQ